MELSLIARVLGHKLMDRYDGWRDLTLDRRYGIDTTSGEGRIADAASCLRTFHGHHYEPIQIPVFRRIMQALPADPAELAFVDLGCGKGKALVLAAEHGFRRVMGVECDRRLYAAAQRNVRAYCDAVRRRDDIEVILGDAAQHPLPGEDCVCFLYNTLDEVAMPMLLARIGRSLQETPRRLFVAYRNPVHGDLLSAARFLRALVRTASFEIYQGVSA